MLITIIFVITFLITFLYLTTLLGIYINRKPIHPLRLPEHWWLLYPSIMFQIYFWFVKYAFIAPLYIY